MAPKLIPDSFFEIKITPQSSHRFSDRMLCSSSGSAGTNFQWNGVSLVYLLVMFIANAVSAWLNDVDSFNLFI